MVSEKIEPLGFVVDKFKGFTKSTQDFANGVLHNIGLSRRRHPIEILKRLQRDAFSDIMKLRDRQDKVERLLSFKSSKVSPLAETSTRVKGEIEVLGLLLMIDRIHEENQDAISRTGIKTGINSKFTFETTIREKDTLKAEFVATDRGQFDGLSTPLSLGKVVFDAKINEWCSLTTVLLGGRCIDLMKQGVTNGPPLLNQDIGSGISLTMTKSNVIGTLAQFVGTTHWLSTFGQVAYQLSGSTKVLLLGINQVPKILGQDGFLGPMCLPIGVFRRDGIRREGGRSVALVLESELDSSTRVGGWVEMNRSDTDNDTVPYGTRWGVSVSDLPEDDFGWGLRVGGSAFERFEVEVFSKMNLGEKYLLQPSLVFVVDGSTKFPALMMKSSWSF
ncbi:uncharacterized protein LOC111914287 [Lactuca sativa]|uniref:uncharacterized protein LOC111914287 n=1 Tax=Lactuca sativa TaxID=4236 RepID=UPI000CC9CB70|nr:uncharacterized protein LOC111914287 [Lactuca sativa]